MEVNYRSKNEKIAGGIINLAIGLTIIVWIGAIAIISGLGILVYYLFLR